MSKPVLFIVGAPGTGKTTLSRSLLRIAPITFALPKGGYRLTPKWTVTEHLIAAGHYTGAVYDGTDTISFTGAMDVLGFWRQKFMAAEHWAHRPMILDGQRTTSLPLLKWLRAGDMDVRCLHLTGDFDELRRRRTDRANEGDKMQADSFVRGRATAAANFAEHFAAGKLRTIDTTKSILLDIAQAAVELLEL